MIPPLRAGRNAPLRDTHIVSLGVSDAANKTNHRASPMTALPGDPGDYARADQ